MTGLGSWWRRRVWRWQTAVGLGSVLLGIAALISTSTNLLDETNEHRNDATLREIVARQDYEQKCRFDLSQPVSDAQAEKLDGLAQGLVALQLGDDAEVARQIDRIRAASRREQAALAERADAVETCNRRAERIYGTDAMNQEDP